MERKKPKDSRPKTIRTLRIAIVSAAVVLGLVVLFETNRQPRTDDAEVLANFIGIAPQVEGPIARLSVRDNQFVKKGELLFEIDDRPFRYALERAQSEQAALEGQIADDRRAIAAQQNAVFGAKAVIEQSKAQVEQAGHAVTTLEPLTTQRGARTSSVQTAQYNLDNCKVYAPFDALVTNLTISEGAYVHTGEQIFTLIDARTWWEIGNLRETQL